MDNFVSVVHTLLEQGIACFTELRLLRSDFAVRQSEVQFGPSTPLRSTTLVSARRVVPTAGTGDVVGEILLTIIPVGLHGKAALDLEEVDSRLRGLAKRAVVTDRAPRTNRRLRHTSLITGGTVTIHRRVTVSLQRVGSVNNIT